MLIFEPHGFSISTEQEETESHMNNGWFYLLNFVVDYIVIIWYNI